MLKTSLLVLAICFVGATSNYAVAQEHKKASTEGENPITYEMLVKQYHFPVKQQTGNPEKDQQVYAAAKHKWIAKNQELYRRYNQQGATTNPQQRKNNQHLFSPTK